MKVPARPTQFPTDRAKARRMRSDRDGNKPAGNPLTAQMSTSQGMAECLDSSNSIIKTVVHACQRHHASGIPLLLLSI